MAVLATLTAAAQGNRIYIEDFEIDRDSTKTVQVMLANVDPTRGIQFNLTLPAGLMFEDYEETAYSRRYTMSLTSRFVPEYNGYLIFLYTSKAHDGCNQLDVLGQQRLLGWRPDDLAMPWFDD